MSKIIGIPVGTPLSPEKIKEKLNPVTSVNGVEADENGNVDVSDVLTEGINTALQQAKESGEFDGKPGKTPVKGTDYCTEADKTEMVNAVIAALPTWTGGSY